MSSVLLVEDSATQREEIRFALESDGFEVAAVASGEAALEYLSKHTVDLLVSDVLMPGMSGYELCRALRAGSETHDLPVVLMTMLEDPREIMHALACGADSFVTKSHGLETIGRRARTLLESRSLRAANSDRQHTPVIFMGNESVVSSERGQILDLLLATFEDYVRTNEALVRAERTKREMSSMIVHDLKSPAAGLMMLARGQMRRVQATDSDRRVWSMVFSIAETCQRMALNLLDVAKSEDGKLRASLADVDLAAVIKDAVLMLEPAASDREQKIVVTASLDTVRADSELLRRVISNLVDNAVRYSPPRESILVEAKSERGRAVIRVSNKGNPIPVEMREKIFDKYVRLESSEQVSTGRGLGLSFCKIAVEAMGGTIGVEDAAGGRTAFTITL